MTEAISSTTTGRMSRTPSTHSLEAVGVQTSIYARCAIRIVGWVYSSRQNGLVVSPGGLCPCIGVGNHSGVEPKMEVRYESE